MANDYEAGIQKVVVVDVTGQPLDYEAGVQKIELDSARMDSLETSLAQKAQYPILTGEVGVVNVTYPYGNVMRYGAIGTDNSNNDETTAFQNAINNASSLGYKVTVPTGMYYVKSTLYLPPFITIEGSSNQDGTLDLNGLCRIHTLAKEVFKPQSNATCRVNFRYLMFQNRSAELYSTVFSGFDLCNSFIFHNAFYNYGIFLFGKITEVTTIQKNKIEHINVNCLVTYLDPTVSGLTNSFTNTDSTITDSNFIDNYVNGNPNNNVTLFNLQYPAFSKFTHNFIDFAKVAFYISVGSENADFSHNTIDYCYRGFKGLMVMCSITNNRFNHMKKTYSGSFPNADSDMVNTTWVCIEPDANTQLNRSLVANNATNACEKFLTLSGYGCYSLKVVNNHYDDPTNTSMVDYNVTKVGYIGNDQKDIFISDLMYKTFTILPDPTVTSDGTGGIKITTFNKQIAFYNGKMIYNDNGTWKDTTGTIVT